MKSLAIVSFIILLSWAAILFFTISYNLYDGRGFIFTVDMDYYYEGGFELALLILGVGWSPYLLLEILRNK
jgi:hypothetical protein